MLRWLLVLCLLVLPLSLGCTGSKELGPADENDTPVVDQADIQRQMRESMEKAKSGGAKVKEPASLKGEKE